MARRSGPCEWVTAVLPWQDEVTLVSGSLRWGYLVLAALGGSRGGSLRGSLQQNSRWVTSAALAMQNVT